MTLRKLLRAEGMDTETYRYESEVARRIVRAVGPWLDADDCFALMTAISVYSFRFEDGFVINESSAGHPERTLGLTGAASVAACFDVEGSHDGYWYAVNYPAHDKERDEFAARLDAIVARLRRHAMPARSPHESKFLGSNRVPNGGPIDTVSLTGASC